MVFPAPWPLCREAPVGPCHWGTPSLRLDGCVAVLSGAHLAQSPVSPRCPNGTSMSLGLAIHRRGDQTTHTPELGRSLGEGGGAGSILTLRYVSKDATCDLSWESPWLDIMPGPPFPPHRGLVPSSLYYSASFVVYLCCCLASVSRLKIRSHSHGISLTHNPTSSPLPIGLSRTPRTRQLRSGAVLHNTHTLPTLSSHVTGRQQRRSRGALTRKIPFSRLRPLLS